MPQDIPTDVVAEVIGKVKRSHPVYDTPVSVAPHTTVGEALSLIPKRAHGLAVVIENGRPLGTVSEIEAAGVDRFAQVHQVMSGDLLDDQPGGLANRDLRRADPPAPRSGARQWRTESCSGS